jgi:hypothetical protein
MVRIGIGITEHKNKAGHGDMLSVARCYRSNLA